MDGNGRTYRITLTGVTPLLMHYDNLAHADEMDAWKNSQTDKTKSKAGDDRTPPWRWIGCVYHDGTLVVVPSENIMRSLMEGAALVPMPGGRSGKTFKSESQSGVMPDEMGWPLTTARGVCPHWEDILSVKDTRRFDTFQSNVEYAKSLGFDLLVKRAKIGTSKHVRVRPIFAAGWQATGHLNVVDDRITQKNLELFLANAGLFKGIGDWRPGCRTPGPYGKFMATVQPVPGNGRIR